MAEGYWSQEVDCLLVEVVRRVAGVVRLVEKLVPGDNVCARVKKIIAG